jgi:FkbM family methyltransferase
VRSKSVIIDLGANIGKNINNFLLQSENVLAYEPNPFAFKVLNSRFNDNNRVQCFNLAVSDKNEETQLYLHENSIHDQIKWSTGSSMYESKGNVNKNNKLTIRTIDILDIVEDQDAEISLLKIDVEGMEYRILNRLIESNAYKKINLIKVELHADRIYCLKKEEEMLFEKIKKYNIDNICTDWI